MISSVLLKKNPQKIVLPIDNNEKGTGEGSPVFFLSIRTQENLEKSNSLELHELKNKKIKNFNI